jgi:hypothetical protein
MAVAKPRGRPRKDAVKPTQTPEIKTHNRGGRREGSGRKLFEPTDKERRDVEAMAGYGITHDQIRMIIRDGISKETLEKHFYIELKRGRAKANVNVAKSLYQKCLAGDTTAMIWWTKSQMKWSDTQVQEVAKAIAANWKVNPVKPLQNARLNS